MNQIKISEIMDNYTDSDMIYSAEADIDAEKVKNRVLKMTKRKGIKKPLKIFAAAAAAVFCLSAAIVASDIPGRLIGNITTLSNVKLNFHRGGTNAKLENTIEPFEYRNGRIIFTALGEETDITDLIDDETPYIAPYISSDTGNTSYIVIGGKPGHTGFQEFVNIGTEEEPYWTGYGKYAMVKSFLVYGAEAEYYGLTFNQEQELLDSDTSHSVEDGFSEEKWENRFVRSSDRVMPWAMKAIETLNLFEAKERMCADIPVEFKDEMFIDSLMIPCSMLTGSVEPFEKKDIMENPYGADISLAGKSPVELKDGRLFVTVNGKEKDITDLTDENTPYIEAIEGAPCEAWLIAGGTAENYGGLVIYNIASYDDGGEKYGFFKIDRSFNLVALGERIPAYIFTVDGEEISYEQLKEYLLQGVDLNGRFDCVDVRPGWYKKAFEELAIDGNLRYVE